MSNPPFPHFPHFVPPPLGLHIISQTKPKRDSKIYFQHLVSGKMRSRGTFNRIDLNNSLFSYQPPIVFSCYIFKLSASSDRSLYNTTYVCMYVELCLQVSTRDIWKCQWTIVGLDFNFGFNGFHGNGNALLVWSVIDSYQLMGWFLLPVRCSCTSPHCNANLAGTFAH